MFNYYIIFSLASIAQPPYVYVSDTARNLIQAVVCSLVQSTTVYGLNMYTTTHFADYRPVSDKLSSVYTAYLSSTCFYKHGSCNIENNMQLIYRQESIRKKSLIMNR